MRAPERCCAGKVALVAQRIGEHNAIDAAGRGATDDIDDNVRVSQGFNESIDAPSSYRAKKFVCHTIDVNSERNAAVHDYPEPDLATRLLAILPHSWRGSYTALGALFFATHNCV
jgi:hypothetical protein